VKRLARGYAVLVAFLGAGCTADDVAAPSHATHDGPVAAETPAIASDDAARSDASPAAAATALPANDASQGDAVASSDAAASPDTAQGSDAGGAVDAATAGGLSPLPPSGSVTNVQMLGSAGYSHLATIVILAADQIKNAATKSSGTLRLELWLTVGPYASSSSGYKPAQFTLGALAAGASLMKPNSGALPWVKAPPGAYKVAIVLTEQTGATTNDGFSHVTHFVFSDPYVES
jgi:hypothetical protein